MARFQAIFWLLLQTVVAIQLDVDDPASLKSAASTAAKKLLSYYVGDQPGNEVGILPLPYYWWEGGAMWMTLLDYWKITGDDTYNARVKAAMLYQASPTKDFLPQEYRGQLGNDDQAFWAMAAMNAVEYNLPDSTEPKDPSWLALVQAVFNEQVARWDSTKCGGGLFWQIYSGNKGALLKNTISTGCFFHIAARLARYSGDQLYENWANTAWDWMKAVDLIDNNWSVYDSVDSTQNCSTPAKVQWTYNAGTLMAGAATMYNLTGQEKWKNRTQGLVDTTIFAFFPNGIMKDVCEQNKVCNNDQLSFKAYLSAWMARTALLAPFTYSQIIPVLKTSAVAAAKQCSGGTDGTTCGIEWFMNSTYDGTNGPGQQMSAMEVFLSASILNNTTSDSSFIPLTNQTGGTSKNDPTAGDIGTGSQVPIIAPATTKDRIGAAILTAFFCTMDGNTGPLIKEKRMSAFVLPLHGKTSQKGNMKEKETEVLDLRHSGPGLRSSKTGSQMPEKPDGIQSNPLPIYRGGTMQT
ncbi:glycoside hydrolase family 76 protein [Calycina marina]|uniref:mannan endo-1,6-alpha-mannosidase n=1 Tax=Calycina marina TaxID=1763456 RepID=A0A9P8CG93_9HELO|nr:glycoside hydrolase family 76 protein [Calycina marina]